MTAFVKISVHILPKFLHSNLLHFDKYPRIFSLITILLLVRLPPRQLTKSLREIPSIYQLMPVHSSVSTSRILIQMWCVASVDWSRISRRYTFGHAQRCVKQCVIFK
ncbi:hypothetical protein CEXT_130101 [Caerostris extrusa]|uniref:Uncharacterized protein n=1 Tax=Caerostris extrusa TaxID=172846 RepID=A0AAV4PLD8_CAEEX|nr:hypothetical protein CEXT_130101 [Caerostris extrusa]